MSQSRENTCKLEKNNIKEGNRFTNLTIHAKDLGKMLQRERAPKYTARKKTKYTQHNPKPLKALFTACPVPKRA